MLKLKTMYGLMSLNEYLAIFERQGLTDVQKAYEDYLVAEERVKTLINISLYWENQPLNYHLQLMTAPSLTPYKDCFMITYLWEDDVLQGNRLLLARRSNLKRILHLWLKEIELFMYTGISSYLSGTKILPQEVHTRLSQLEEVHQSKTENQNLLKNQLRIQIGDERFYLSEFDPQSKPLQNPQINQLVYTWYDQFLTELQQGTWIKLADSKYEYIAKVPGTTMTITLEKEGLVLPITFSFALQANYGSEWNDGEVSAQWLWGIHYNHKDVYLPIGGWIEYGYFDEDIFIAAVSEMFEGINSCEEFMELLVLEAKSGMNVSTKIVQKQYEAILSKADFCLSVESGVLYRKTNLTNQAQVFPQMNENPYPPLFASSL